MQELLKRYRLNWKCCNINNYNYSNDYAKQQENIVKKITIDEPKVFEMYLNANKMIYLIVGDAKRN
jgi:zinc protease